MRTLASLGMGEGQLCSCAVVVLCWRWAVLELRSQMLFFWRKDVKKGEGGAERMNYFSTSVCWWRRKKERMKE